MSLNESEIRIQVHIDDFDLLRELFGNETPQNGQVVETDGYTIAYRGISRSRGITQQDFTILIAINVATSFLTSVTTSLLAYWIFSKLSRSGRFPIQVGSDPFYKTTSLEIEAAIKADARLGACDKDSGQNTTQQSIRIGAMPNNGEKTAMRRQLSGLLEEQLKDIAHDLGLASYISSKASASELSRSIVQAASQSPGTWQWLLAQFGGRSNLAVPLHSNETQDASESLPLDDQTGSKVSSSALMNDAVKRFEVALTFPGECRDFVAGVAECLAQSLSKSKVFYDRFYLAELARPNLDTYLQDIYEKHSALVVVFLCEAYAEMEWCGLEFRVVRSLIKQRKDDQIMFVRLDEGAVRGVFQIDGYLDAQGQTAKFVCEAILERATMIHTSAIGVQQLTQKAIASVVSEFDELSTGKPHSVCRQYVFATLKDRAERWALLQWNAKKDVKTYEQLLSDADAMLFSSEQYLGHVQQAHVAKAICLLGQGLCKLYTYSGSLERLFIETARRITKLTELDLGFDDQVGNRVLVHADRGDLRSALEILGFDADLD